MSSKSFATRELINNTYNRMKNTYNQISLEQVEELYNDFLKFVRIHIDNGYEVTLKNIGTFSYIGFVKEKLNTSDIIDEYIKTRNYPKKFVRLFLTELPVALKEILFEGYAVYLTGLGLLYFSNVVRLKFIPNAAYIRFNKSSYLAIKDGLPNAKEISYEELKVSLEAGTPLRI